MNTPPTSPNPLILFLTVRACLGSFLTFAHAGTVQLSESIRHLKLCHSLKYPCWPLVPLLPRFSEGCYTAKVDRGEGSGNMETFKATTSAKIKVAKG